MVDYEYKSLVLRSGFCELRRKVDFAFYLERYHLENNFSIPYEEAYSIFAQYGELMEWGEAGKINKAFYERVKRLKKRVAELISSPSVFLSLTFTDAVLASTSAQTRRKYVTRYLKANYPNYIANIDFGKTNGREHYHALIQGDNVCYKDWHCYGAIKGERVVVENVTALAKYVSKLTNHAIKETTKRSAVIYSR